MTDVAMAHYSLTYQVNTKKNKPPKLKRWIELIEVDKRQENKAKKPQRKVTEEDVIKMFENAPF